MQTLFIESQCTDQRIIEENVRSVKISSPDVSDVSRNPKRLDIDCCLQYVGWSADEAVKHYLQRISAKIPHFESMEERELDFIKVRRQKPLSRRLLTNTVDDRCWGEAYHQQLYIRLPISPHRILSTEPPYKVETHILRKGRFL
jgi:hypothetical protein